MHEKVGEGLPDPAVGEHLMGDQAEEFVERPADDQAQDEDGDVGDDQGLDPRGQVLEIDGLVGEGARLTSFSPCPASCPRP